MSKPDDMIGLKFGKLTVLERADDYVSPNGVKGAQYVCRCECSKNAIVTVRKCNLKSGTTTSCGCEWQTRMTQIFSKHNKYILNEEYGIGFASNSNAEFYFDLEYFDLIKNYCWYQDKKDKYLKTNDKNRNNDLHRTILLHRIIMRCDDDNVIDHINRNRVDCRKENLRISSNRDNARNRNVSKNNASGFTGIFYDKKRHKWGSQLIIDDKKVYFKRFDDKEDAIKARLEAELKYFGKEFAPQRHLFEEYDI